MAILDEASNQAAGAVSVEILRPTEMLRHLAALAIVFALRAAMRLQQHEFVPLPTQPMPPALVP
jgi:hypothetical protein